MLFWLDGRLVEEAEARFPLLSHSLHYGSAVFDGLRFYETAEGPAAFRLEEHIERFLHSARQFRLALPYGAGALRDAVFQTIRVNALRAGYARPIAFLGGGDMELNAVKADLHVAVAVWPWSPRLGTEAIRVRVSSYRRSSPKSTVLSAKLTGHYANSILARQEARDGGFHEALLLDHEGNVAEGPGANFFAVKDGVLVTPPAEKVFAGITRDSMLALAGALGIPSEVRDIAPAELPACQEAFFAGTAVEAVPIAAIDGTAFATAPGPVTERLKAAFADAACGRERRFARWRSVVPR